MTGPGDMDPGMLDECIAGVHAMTEGWDEDDLVHYQTVAANVAEDLLTGALTWPEFLHSHMAIFMHNVSEADDDMAMIAGIGVNTMLAVTFVVIEVSTLAGMQPG